MERKYILTILLTFTVKESFPNKLWHSSIAPSLTRKIEETINSMFFKVEATPKSSQSRFSGTHQCQADISGAVAYTTASCNCTLILTPFGPPSTVYSLEEFFSQVRIPLEELLKEFNPAISFSWIEIFSLTSIHVVNNESTQNASTNH